MIRRFNSKFILSNQVRCYSSKHNRNFIVISQNMYSVSSQPYFCRFDEEYDEAIEIFTDQINDRIDAGYIPCGVIIPVTYKDSLWWLHQPMIKKSIINEEKDAEKKPDKKKVEKQESETKDQNVKTEAESKYDERNTYYGGGMGARGGGSCGML